jgi:hypothetical protein
MTGKAYHLADIRFISDLQMFFETESDNKFVPAARLTRALMHRACHAMESRLFAGKRVQNVMFSA